MEHKGSGVATAMVPVTPPPLPERGPIEAAQVARHLAILGSCAAALSRDDDQPHHYLATRAHYSRLAGGPETLVGGMLRAEAVASWPDKRTARALVKLMTTDGDGLHLLDVHYSVLTPRMFERLHPHTDAESESAIDPLVDSGPEMDSELVVAGSDGVTVDGGIIPESVCAGHFARYPAAPVAIVMGRLCRAAGLGLAAKLDRELEYQIEEGHVVANKLARAGQRLVLEARYGRPVGAGHLMYGTARADGEVIGEVAVTLSTVEPRESKPF